MKTYRYAFQAGRTHLPAMPGSTGGAGSEAHAVSVESEFRS